MPIQADLTQSRTLISQSSHPAGAHYLALLPDGRVLAGHTESTARVYANAQDCYDSFHDGACQGDAHAWNICYQVQDYAQA